MKKVKIMASMNAIELEESINEFIAGKNIIDIKYSPVVVTGSNSVVVGDRVLIIYED